MAILVTGGAGYIGSHTCVELLKAGYEVIILDNLSNSKQTVIQRIQEISNKQIKYYEVNLLNQKDLEKVFKENNIEAVIHFAGLKAVGESVKFPILYYHNNITGTLLLCETMEKYHVRKMVFSSSATVYGVPDKIPISEDAPLRAINPYGQTKLIIENFLSDLYSSNPNWSISILRYFNPIGAHKSGRIGEDPSGIPNNLMPYITQVAIGNLKELSIFGGDYPTKDGTGIRDFIHVVDLAKGHLKALEKVGKSKGLNVYNLGTGKGYSVFELITAFEKATGIKIPYKVVGRRPGDVASCYANPTKAKTELEWTAEKNIIEMCQDAWRWQKDNPTGYVDS